MFFLQIEDLVPPTVDDVADVEAKEEGYQLGDCPVVGRNVYEHRLRPFPAGLRVGHV